MVIIFLFIKKKPDIFIIQSPPLFIALSGLLLAKLLRAKIILNVSDLWPLSGLELGVLKKGFLYSILEKIESTNYKLADKIIGQSQEIIAYISKKVSKEFLMYRNVPSYKKYPPKEKGKTLRIVYAGLLGYPQGILEICREINFKSLGVEFHIYGAGMEEENIKKIVKASDANIYFHGAKDSKNIKDEIFKYDVSLTPLKISLYGAIPTKIFEVMQLGIPILFSGSGEGKTIILNEKVGLFSNSMDYKSLISNIDKFKNMNAKNFNDISKNALKAHKEKYNLESQIEKLNKFIQY